MEKSEDLSASILKGRLPSGLLSMHSVFAREHSSLRIMYKPHRAVFIDAPIAKGKLRLAPATTTIILAKGPADKPPPGSIAMDVVSSNSDENIRAHIVHTAMMPKLPGGQETGFINPFFFVRATAEESEANMEIIHQAMTISQQVNIGKGNGTGKAKVDKGEGKDNSDSLRVEVPTMHNVKALKAGDQLLMHQAPEAPKRPLNELVLPAKRSKA